MELTGNNTRQDWTFDQRKRISQIQVTGPSGVLDKLNYTLSPAGNVLTINDNSYSYDGFNRVAQANTKLPESIDTAKLVQQHFGTYKNGSAINGVAYDPLADLNSDDRINGVDDIIASYNPVGDQYDIENFSYDANGNRTSLVQNGNTYSYEYGPRNQLTKIYLQAKGDSQKTLFAEYSYDANGNTVSRILHTANGVKNTDFKYDTLNRLVITKENGKETTYSYDNAGNRLYKSSADGLTLYLRHGQIAVAMDIEVNFPDSAEGKTKQGSINRYVLSGDLLAGRISLTIPLSGPTTTAKSYYHLDHQNSTKDVSDQNGVLEVQYVYRAFGEQLRKLGTGDATYTFGGKELDEVTKLYYFNARYYDATTGRFINVDPIQDGSNWYVYCSNNPLNFTDPTGLDDFSLSMPDLSCLSNLFGFLGNFTHGGDKVALNAASGDKNSQKLIKTVTPEVLKSSLYDAGVNLLKFTKGLGDVIDKVGTGVLLTSAVAGQPEGVALGTTMGWVGSLLSGGSEIAIGALEKDGTQVQSGIITLGAAVGGEVAGTGFKSLTKAMKLTSPEALFHAEKSLKEVNHMIEVGKEVAGEGTKTIIDSGLKSK